MNGSPLAALLNAYSLVVFVRVIISWIQLPPNNPIAHYSRVLTEPVLEPIRKLLPASGGLDFSPLILLVLLQVIAGLV